MITKVVQNGQWVVVDRNDFSPPARIFIGESGVLLGFSSSYVKIQDGDWIETYDENGIKVNSEYALGQQGPTRIETSTDKNGNQTTTYYYRGDGMKYALFQFFSWAIILFLCVLPIVFRYLSQPVSFIVSGVLLVAAIVLSIVFRRHWLYKLLVILISLGILGLFIWSLFADKFPAFLNSYINVINSGLVEMKNQFLALIGK